MIEFFTSYPLEMTIFILVISACVVFFYRRKARVIQITNNELTRRNASLQKYEGIENAEAQAREIVSKAQRAYEEAHKQARIVADRAKDESAKLLADSANQGRQFEADGKQSLDSAVKKSEEIIALAHKKAEEIAGAAYRAMGKADLYEKTVKAMKNIIDGYGARFLVPSQSVLDGLAIEFGFTEAGQELARARDLVKSMIRNGTAAACDYVEISRRETAIAFVLDAFNGKVDSILSRSKHDNYGTLTQEMHDAFILVKKNGSAFRDARITDAYLDARLNELKWACAVQQLKLKAREEQRVIREQIREEEKAKREYERAMKEAAKEEDYLHRAMARAQEGFDKANAEQKLGFEKQLNELAAKLKEAEEKSQRALSMAQQTKRGHVYVISNVGSFGEDVYKIGLTRRLEPLDRVRELGDSSVPFEFDVHALILSDDAPALEHKLHKHFVLAQVNKVNYRKEFFRVPLADIRRDIDAAGLEVKWTMAAEASEYRESLAVEEAIKTDPKKREEWLRRQFLLEKTDQRIEESLAVVPED